MTNAAASVASRMLESIIILPLFLLRSDMIFQVCIVQIYRFFRDGAYTDYGSGYHHSGNVSPAAAADRLFRAVLTDDSADLFYLL